MMHIGTGLVCGTKIKDMVQAGFHFIIFLADWHSMINNKYGGDMEKIETAGEYFKHCFTALGLTEDKVEYVWASELASKPNYWEESSESPKLPQPNGRCDHCPSWAAT